MAGSELVKPARGGLSGVPGLLRELRTGMAGGLLPRLAGLIELRADVGRVPIELRALLLELLVGELLGHGGRLVKALGLLVQVLR